MSDAGSLFALYLSSTPKEPFQWVADYKPIAQVYADQEAAYEKVSAAAAAANTPEKRADALKQVQDLKAHTKGKLAVQLGKFEQDLQKTSAGLNAAYNQQVDEAKQHDQAALLDAKHKYAAFCANYRFDDAQAAIEAATVSTPEGTKQKAVLLKKAEWLRQFKAQLIQDINAYGYPNPIMNRTGGRLPDGQKKATDAGLTVQTPFGALPFPWISIPPNELLAISSLYAQNMATTAPEQAAARQWLSGVFACEEGMAREGRALLVQASQVKDEYKNELNLFVESE